MPESRSDPETIYHARRQRFDALRRQYEQRSNRQGNLNLLLFLLAGLLAGLALWRHLPALYFAAGGMGLAFIAALVYHDRLHQRLQRYATLLALSEEGLARWQRNWDALPLPERHSERPSLPAPALDEATAFDLDLLGRASLQHLLGTANTPAGQATLRRWILQPATSETARRRQAAAAELAPQIDWRDEVGVRGRLMGPAQADYERLIAWAEGGGWLRRRPWLLWLARLLTLLALGLLAALFLGPRLPGVRSLDAAVLPALGIVLLANLALTLTYGRQAGHEIEEVAARQRVFAAYAEIFDLVSGQRFAAPCLADLQARLSAGGLRAGDQMRRLGRLMPAAEIRHWMFFLLIEVPTLWSVHLLWLLESWQAVAGGQVRAWLAALGEMEALIALATLHHDHPAWAFPELVESAAGAERGQQTQATPSPGDRAEAPPGATFVAENLAHPLLPPARAVGNDVQVGPPGTFLLVTGSNMSGKSTLLRAIGVNAVLAQMGGPVCAARLAMPPLAVASSMRVQDSLEQGVSTYMAELRRLKAIVDLADARRGSSGPTLLFLLDEILQGTNTAERQIAARRIISHLTGTGAIGAVSTHDLTLAEGPEIAGSAVPVHSSETFTRSADGPAMTFDYRLRPGIATSTNALRLMEIIGLPAR